MAASGWIGIYIIHYLGDSSYICGVIAHFVPNFVPFATRVSLGKIRLAAFRGPSTKPPFRRKNLADISYTDRVIAFLSQISLPWQRGSVGENAIGSIRWPISENPPIGAKVSQ